MNREFSLDNPADNHRLKVVHKKSGNLQVYFPFSEVPVEMTPQYFEKNINSKHYIIDFLDEFERPIAG